ncbi:MAG: sigma-70 family RNA polymerase sigma factor, partial [Lewinella sp.]|nr:sigma-70 family RNA polymerase sigma factor [Lewinella sp.]
DYAASLDAEVRNPEEEIIRRQRLKLMRSLMDQLNEKYRVMIELRYFDELSYEEIAAELDLPLGTVKAQLFRAKEMLYELLQRPGASAYLDRTRR